MTTPGPLLPPPPWLISMTEWWSRGQTHSKGHHPQYPQLVPPPPQYPSQNAPPLLLPLSFPRDPHHTSPADPSKKGVHIWYNFMSPALFCLFESNWTPNLTDTRAGSESNLTFVKEKNTQLLTIFNKKRVHPQVTQNPN